MSFHSAPHGAGRRYSRTKARSLFKMDDLRKAMEGIEFRDSKVLLADSAGRPGGWYRHSHATRPSHQALASPQAPVRTSRPRRSSRGEVHRSGREPAGVPQR